MKNIPSAFLIFCLGLTRLIAAAQPPSGNTSVAGDPGRGTPEILTPPPPRVPAIHGPKIFGVRPGSAVLFSIPATGDRPMWFAAHGLPQGVKLNRLNGLLTGTIKRPGSYRTKLYAHNHLATVERDFTIRVGDDICLTPPMGWNSYNVWGANIDSVRLLSAAKAMVESGLSQHGFTYINIDDGWQGARGGKLHAVQPDPIAFPDIARTTQQIHALGLKVGIYHTPWVTSYGRRVGASSEKPDGAWDKSLSDGPRNRKILPHAIGKYHFMKQDAQQFAEWNVDYLKYDWAPVEAPETEEMEAALRSTGRDIVFSLSNNATNSLLNVIGEVRPHANLWRTNHDIDDSWKTVVRNGFDQDAWAPFQGPGHFNDPDMLVVGVVGWGKPHPTRLTPDEQYTHVSLWCLLSAPLILGNNLEQLDDFTKSLLTNDEVLDVDQDSLGRQANMVREEGETRVYGKPLADGSWAVGLFNLGSEATNVRLSWVDLGIRGKQTVRDLWRQKDLGSYDEQFASPVAAHGVRLLRIIKSK